jgi:hypothetical protein
MLVFVVYSATQETYLRQSPRSLCSAGLETFSGIRYHPRGSHWFFTLQNFFDSSLLMRCCEGELSWQWALALFVLFFLSPDQANASLKIKHL